MKIGIPKEIKNNENRVGMLPSGVSQLVADGNTVYVEKNAAIGIGIGDDEYIKAGAVILNSLEEVFEKSDMIIKVKEPQPREIALFRPDHLVYTYLHLSADKELTEGLMKTGATYVAYETVTGKNGTLPLLLPMSEVAGRMGTQVGATYLQKNYGGKGILLGGVTGTERAKVVIIGAGISGQSALKMAVGLNADVTILDIDIEKLRYLDDLYGNKIKTLYSTKDNIEKSVINADLVIGCVLLPGAKAPKLVTEEMIKKMQKGTVLVDIAIDQGGCFETSKATTHENPIYFVHDVLHYCVANMPGAFPKTSTYALNNATLGYARALAKLGAVEACKKYPDLANGLSILNGKLTDKTVAHDLDLPYSELKL
ncbi:MAG: alanine dehydrogenase [Fusobacteriaceae bacterium]|jgi:alanine dehydrogenase|nr:alanine dehydrogenase [Fusobacteriaceae bacterium]MBP6322607.1 alanine dehydrogenase [Fusobacteriaceae bacterium]MBP9510223.1 alanine dehydrogenase [Fusobacteriaceae bacterium]